MVSTFQSSTTITLPISQVYSFLADLNNHAQLMPDNVTDWQSTQTEATFTIKNMAKLALSLTSKTEDSEILIASTTPSPFEVIMRWTLSPLDGQTLVNLNLDAQLTTMMKMLASTALQKLVDYQTDTLKTLLT